MLGTYDLLQKKHTISRNYPILANIRYLLESIGPEIRQYFIQSDTEERPFSREQRTIIYQRAKNVLEDRKSTRLNSSHVKRSRMPSSA